MLPSFEMPPFEITGNIKSLGHHFVVGLSGPELSDLDKRVLNSLSPAGILLSARNFLSGTSYGEWLTKLNALIQQVREYSERERFVVSVDHEGRPFHRLPPPITMFPSAFEYRERAGEVAEAMAVELKATGINLSWAPVADINWNPANPIIGERAFGSTPDEVCAPAVETSQTLIKNGILSCAKHFPGHGGVNQDSHFTLPVLAASEEELMNRDLIPFRALIESGVPLIMTAHIMYPHIDKLYPATLSARILHDLLRQKLGFQGLIVADDLDMEAVYKEMGDEDMIAVALNATCDWFIVARSKDPAVDRSRFLAENIFKGLKKQLVREEQLHDSYVRINELFRRFPLDSNCSKLSEEILERHADLSRQIAACAPNASKFSAR